MYAKAKIPLRVRRPNLKQRPTLPRHCAHNFVAADQLSRMTREDEPMSRRLTR
ncbi:hypothetical protein PILCRDRAFT_814008 [Piloderma croceum F 1598]|uniref:Uncharacterized protein n=1 Tax=Piloderma croceum (strain F 1598) TaxID=765440 RepID=A0A0C3G8Q4_PILCF|nr:hypothetical protein PILCRDRAFT_814008 [Piloderma croceum F 1598]